MANDFKPVHGFRLNAADGAGAPSIFLLSVFPESIIDVQPSASGGSSITIRMASGDSGTFEFTQSAELVQQMIQQCKELDRAAGLADNRES